MRKIFRSLLIAGALSLSMALPAFAGSWQQDAAAGTWKYQNDDGTYFTNSWQWIDGNGDGIAESYYFDAQGNLLVNTTTPDGYTVDANGAWTVNGVVQTQAVSAAAPAQSDATTQSAMPAQSAMPTQSDAATQNSQTTSSVQPAVSGKTGISTSAYDGYTIVVNTNTKKYHRPGCSSVKDIKAKNMGYSSDAAYLESLGYAACKRCH